MIHPMSSILKRGMTPTHQMIGEWILQNPGGTLRAMGEHFGYSISWLSQVINTDMFKAYMAERMKDVQAAVTLDIPAQLRGVAQLSVEKIGQVLEKTEDPELIVDIFDKVMHRYGFAPNAKTGAQAQAPGIGNQTNVQNNFFVSREDYERAQKMLVEQHTALPGPQVVELSGAEVPAVLPTQ